MRVVKVQSVELTSSACCSAFQNEAREFLEEACKRLVDAAAQKIEDKVKATSLLVGSSAVGVWQTKRVLRDYADTLVLAEESLLKGNYAQRVLNMTKDVEKERCYLSLNKHSLKKNVHQVVFQRPLNQRLGGSEQKI